MLTAEASEIEMGSTAVPLRVLAWPGFGNAHVNPYNASLFTEITRLGVVVDEFRAWKVFCRRYDIVHIHWPEHCCGRIGPARFSPSGNILSIVMWAPWVLLSILRWRGATLIWTVHNARPHGAPPDRPWIAYSRFFRVVDGLLFLSTASVQVIHDLYPESRRKPYFVTPHGVYFNAQASGMPRDEARIALGIEASKIVFAFVGKIQPYKNVSELIELVKSSRRDDLSVVIAGQPAADGYVEQLQALAGDDRRICFRLGFIPESALPIYAAAADAFVFPYRDILNSGSVILGLSLQVPVICPNIGALRELSELVGGDWMYSYEGSLRNCSLDEIVTWSLRPRTGSPDLSSMSWKNIALQTLQAYQRIRSGSGSARRAEVA